MANNHTVGKVGDIYAEADITIFDSGDSIGKALLITRTWTKSGSCDMRIGLTSTQIRKLSTILLDAADQVDAINRTSQAAQKVDLAIVGA